MKYTAVILLFLTAALFLASCSVDHNHYYYSSTGNLKIYNNTNAPVTVTWTANGHHDDIDANSSRTFEFSMKSAITDPKGISTTYTCDGLYLHSTTFSDVIYDDQTTIRSLEPDRGCIRFVNNTAGHVDIEIPGLNNPIVIGAYSSYIQAWIVDGSSALANFSYSGDFVFSNNDDMMVYLNATGTYQISASGASIKVRNNSTATITAVYLSPHSDSGWGNDDLTGTIAPGNYVTWTVAPNTWDVKVVDEDDYYSTWTSNSYIDFNQMLVINYYQTKKNIDLSNKTNGFGSIHEGQFRIQQQLPNPLEKK